MSTSDGDLVTNSSLIVVSHRLPFSLIKNESGQLTRTNSIADWTDAVVPAVIQSGGKFLKLNI